MKEHAAVIVGAGPTGLMLAAELALAHVDVAIIEKRDSQHLHYEAFINVVEAFVHAAAQIVQPVVCPIHAHRLHASIVPRSTATVAR